MALQTKPAYPSKVDLQNWIIGLGKAAFWLYDEATDEDDCYSLYRASAFLRSLPPRPEDDDHPWDEEWLASVGFRRHKALAIWINSFIEAADDSAKRPHVWYCKGERIPSPLTRGDVRRLLSCLGIPLSQ